MRWFWRKKRQDSENAFTSGSPRQQNGYPPDLQGMPRVDEFALFSLGTVRTEAPHAVILASHDEKDGVFLVISGSVRILRSGKIHVLDLKKGDWFSDRLWKGIPHQSFSVIANEESKILYLDAHQFGTLDDRTRNHIETMLNKAATLLGSQNEKTAAKEVFLSEYLMGYIHRAKMSASSKLEKSPVLRDMIGSIDKLPSSAYRLIQLLGSDFSSIQDLGNEIRNDPVLVSSILRSLNSAYYGLSTKISDINHAILYLGMNQIYQIVVANAHGRISPNTPDFQAVQKHSQAVSYLAAQVCQLHDRRSVPILSTIGILHDIGLILKYHLQAKNSKDSLLTDLLEIPKLGSMLLRSWDLPEIVSEVIEYQEYPFFTSPKNLPSNYKKEIVTLFLGHVLWSMVNKEEGVEALDPILSEHFQFLGLKDMTKESLLNDHVLPNLHAMKAKLPADIRSLLLG